jgi:tetratricopeptide (TPR) repeat protein
VRFARWFSAPALGLLLWGTGPACAADAEKKPPKELASFGTLRAPAPDAARSQALDWLKGVGKADDATLKAFDALWTSDKPLLDKVAATLELGDADAAKLLQEARNADSAAPLEVPALLKDAKKPAFFRSNLALAYGKALSNRKVYEEALEAFKAAKPEQVVDPAALLFHKAVAEHSLMLKTEANGSIVKLLDDVADSPERYRMVAALMSFDMMTWKDKDLDWIARKMDTIQRRLDLARGGKQTQKIQKQVLARLDEMIKELENRNKNGGS